MEQTREDRMRQRMRGAARHQVQDADFGDLFSTAATAPEPEPEAETESSEPPAEPSPVPVKRTSPNTSAKRRRLNSEGPNALVHSQTQSQSVQSSSANRSSRRALRASVNPDPYDLENAPSTVYDDGAAEEEEGQEEEEEEEAAAAETTPTSRDSLKRALGSARPAASKSAAQNHAPQQSSSLKSLRAEEEVTESPADEPGSGHRRRVRASNAVTSSALLQSALRSVDNDTGHDFLQSSSPLSRKSRKSTAGTVASAGSHRTSLRRSTRLSGSPDDEINELSSDLPTASERHDEARVSPNISREEDASAVAETVIEEPTVIAEADAEEAQEINDTNAALRLGRKRPRRSDLTASPALLSPNSPDESAAKRPRRARVAIKESPAKQRQPKAPRAKPSKPAAPRKKKDGDSAGAVAIKIQRFTRPKPRADDDDSGGDDPLNSTIPYASRSGVNAVDVFAQMCEEIIGRSAEKMKEGIRDAQDAAVKKELRVKLMALQAFREEIRTRLLEHTIALDSLFALKKRVREAQRAKLKLRERIIQIRTEREQVQLRMDAVRIKHEEDSKEALHNINLSTAMHDVDLAIEQGRAAPKLSAKEQKTADLANLELLISRVAEQACSNSPSGGALKQIKSFNAFLERAAAALLVTKLLWPRSHLHKVLSTLSLLQSFHSTPSDKGRRTTGKMSWMDSWSRPSKSQSTPAPYYLLPGGEDTPYCHACGRVLSSRRIGSNPGATAATAAAAHRKDKDVKYCSNRCRSHKPGKLDREIEGVFVGFLSGTIEIARDGSGSAASSVCMKTKPQKSSSSKKAKGAGGRGKKMKGDARILVSCDQVERYMFLDHPHEDADTAASATEDEEEEEEDGHTDDSYPGHHHDDVDHKNTKPSRLLPPPADAQSAAPPPPTTTPNSTGTLEDPTWDDAAAARDTIDYDRLARLSIRSGTRIRPPQDVSEVNGSVGGEKGRAERRAETGAMLEKRREGMRRVRQREMVRCAARRGVVFGFEEVGGGDGEGEPGDGGRRRRRKCEAVMLGKVVEPSFAKGDWSVRWRE